VESWRRGSGRGWRTYYCEDSAIRRHGGNIIIIGGLGGGGGGHGGGHYDGGHESYGHESYGHYGGYGGVMATVVEIIYHYNR